jgi:hypothetical protein
MRRLGYSSLLGDYLGRQIRKHPNSNSLAAYHYILSWIGIENLGVHVSADTLATDIPMPAVAHLNRNDGEFVMVKSMDSNTAKITNGGKTENMPRHEFDTIFTGSCIAMAADADIIIDKKDFAQWIIGHFAKHILPVIVGIAIILRIITMPDLDILDIVSIALYIIGLTVSGMLFLKSEGLRLQLTEALCKSGGEASDCSAVTNSKGGKLFGILSWSDVGMIYFTTMLIAVLTFGYAQINAIIFAVAVLSSTYVLYSIWYQWRIVRTWCPLCLIVQGVLLAQLATAIYGLSVLPLQFGIWSFMILCIIAITTVAIFFILKPTIESSIKYPYLEASYMRFRLDTLALYASSAQRRDMSRVSQIMINPQSPNIVTFVFSPFCGPCVAKIKDILALPEKYDIGLRVVFCIKDYENEHEWPIVEYFLEQYMESPNALLKFMQEYAENYSVIRERYKNFVPQNEEAIKSVIAAHNEWFSANGFIGTPVLLYKDIALPPEYTITDIEMMILDEQ